jgi:hypothetical protein
MIIYNKLSLYHFFNEKKMIYFTLIYFFKI